MRLPFRFLRALPDAPCHAVEFYARQAWGLGASPDGNPRIDCPDVPRTFAAIHPFASSPAKRAPMAVFESAAAKLARTMPVYWLVGPEEDLPGAIRIADLYELACWLRGAKIFVGNDSGISHLAAAVGTPVLAFFHASDPKIWAPRGSAVHPDQRQKDAMMTISGQHWILTMTSYKPPTARAETSRHTATFIYI